jgi:hypothetical protein
MFDEASGLILEKQRVFTSKRDFIIRQIFGQHVILGIKTSKFLQIRGFLQIGRF